MRGLLIAFLFILIFISQVYGKDSVVTLKMINDTDYNLTIEIIDKNNIKKWSFSAEHASISANGCINMSPGDNCTAEVKTDKADSKDTYFGVGIYVFKDDTPRLAGRLSLVIDKFNCQDNKRYLWVASDLTLDTLSISEGINEENIAGCSSLATSYFCNVGEVLGLGVPLKANTSDVYNSAWDTLFNINITSPY